MRPGGSAAETAAVTVKNTGIYISKAVVYNCPQQLKFLDVVKIHGLLYEQFLNAGLIAMQFWRDSETCLFGQT